MVDFQLSEEQQMIRDTIGALRAMRSVRRHVLPMKVEKFHPS